MSEALYDSEIAPKLAEVVALCERHGIPFVALCEYEPGQRGRTEFLPHESSAAMKLATYAARCDGNFDSLTMAVQKMVGDNHSSIVLHLLNTPSTTKADK